MFGGGIDCVEDLGVILSACLFALRWIEDVWGGEEFYQWCRASIDELMLGTSWHHHEVPSFDILVFARDCGFAGTGGESQGLVNGVDLKETAVSRSTAVLRQLKRALKKQY